MFVPTLRGHVVKALGLTEAEMHGEPMSEHRKGLDLEFGTRLGIPVPAT